MKYLLYMLLPVLMDTAVTAQVPCNNMPSKTEWKARLAQRPVFNILPKYLSLQCNVDDTIKRRIVYLLNWQWTPQELTAYVDKYQKGNKRLYDIVQKSSESAKGNNAVFLKNLDSLLRAKDPQQRETWKRSVFHVDNGLILAAGHLGIAEARPILEAARKDSLHYDSYVVELALAKLGNKQLQQKIIASTTYDPALSGRNWNEVFEQVGNAMTYLATQESIYRLADWLDSSKMYASTSSGKLNTKNAANVIYYLSQAVLNKDFRDIIKPYTQPWGEEPGAVDDQMILQVKRWLEVNRGKYIINKDYNPY